jgi:hypothetical protein
MLSTHLSSIIAQQHIADLRRAADNHRRAHATVERRTRPANARVAFAIRRRRRVSNAQPASR